ncbi:hypothetical protein CERZMDRAFT_114235 [Cercospora zeae-maydis SCOH1-5]|uniref:Uncharacterized protein n=1 Tax=Cercospora zeae-maydis SCOH1-5 TaxID=717836 RepID=A0A6A6F565_9PEZI|nr:hypothetical protein CERZMDRAFT_114235 [Cercospora zeae-maydis SCOH1-5]
MVLDEATAGPEAFTSDSAPSSDADPYNGDRNPTELETRDPSYVSINQGTAAAIHVRLDSLPKPWHRLWGPLVPRNHAPSLPSNILQTLEQAQQMLGRPVQQPEADALALHSSKVLSVASMGSPFGFLVGTALALRGMSTFRFPGYTPGERFNPDKLWILKGRPARYIWHGLRFQAYWIVGELLGLIFFGSYALTIGTVGRAADPRLKEWNQALQRHVASKTQAENQTADQTPGPREGETMEMARQRQRAQEAWRNSRARQGESSAAKGEGTADNMSPTGGSFGSEYIDLGSAAVSDTAMMSDDQARRQSEGLQRQQEASYSRSHQPQQSQAPASSQPEPVRDAFSSQEESKPVPSGSAWERLRQQAVAGKSSPSPSTSPPSNPAKSSGREDFTFSSRDEDNQLAKAEAQREFDAQIERERSGKDFDGAKRW